MLLSAKTDKQTKVFLAGNHHGLLIIGPASSGKQTLSYKIASTYLGVTEQKLSSSTNFNELDASKSSAGIDEIRQLKRSLAYKAGSQSPKRVQVVASADQLSREAQTAMLKLLEEPTAGTLIILTANNQSALLPTVRSRLWPITINPVGLDEVKVYFKEFEIEKVNKAWHLSGGYPALISQYLSEQDQQSQQSITDAKEVLSQNLYDRLLKINDLSADEKRLNDFLKALGQVLSAAHRSAIKKGDAKSASRLLIVRKQIILLNEHLKANGNVKLGLLELFIKIG